MPAFATVTWNVDWSRLQAVTAATFEPSAVAARERAMSLRHEHRQSGVGMRIVGENTAELVPTGKLGRVFEYGRRGGTKEVPKSKRALAGKGFGPVASSVEGPMRPYPYVRPAAAWWANGGYNGVASKVMAGMGLGV